MTFRPLARAPGPAHASASHAPSSLAHQSVAVPPATTALHVLANLGTSAVTVPAPETPFPPHVHTYLLFVLTSQPARSLPRPPPPGSIQAAEPRSFPALRFSSTMLDVCSFFIVTPSPTHLSEGGRPEGGARISSPYT